jgi:alpha-tubulin suppressor-like RCC1 family protein
MFRSEVDVGTLVRRIAMGVLALSALSLPTSAAATSGRDVLAGTFASPALSSPSGPVAWGDGFSGQLGDGKTESSKIPVAVSGLDEASALAGGGSHSLALLPSGSVMAWGSNGAGQLGTGGTTSSDTPVAVGGISEATAVAASASNSLALLRNGTVLDWGLDEGEALGNGSEKGPESCGSVGSCAKSPIPVSALHEVAAIGAGYRFGLAVLQGGAVRAWGENQQGQLGDGGEAKSDVPVAVSGLTEASAVAGGNGFAFALLRSGRVMAWGSNRWGQLGDGTSSGPETCGHASFQEFPCSLVPVPVSGLSEVTAIAAGWRSSLALLKNGTVMTWGDNEHGQLGDGSTTGPETCTREGTTQPCSTKPVPVSGLSEVTAIAAGFDFDLALLRNGHVMAWGYNGAGGELGDNSTVQSDVPVEVQGLSAASAIAAGENHSLAVGTLSPVPTITSIEPNYGSASGGTNVTITGTNLSEVSAVKFGSTSAASFEVQSETKITATAPPGTGVVPVSVTSPGGTVPGPTFSYAPVVTGIQPMAGPEAGGTRVTITGNNFTGVTAVDFGSSPATGVEIESDHIIRAIAPPGTGTADVTVTGPGGTSPTSTNDHFYYGPTVTKVEPARGVERGGDLVTITGFNLSGATAVKFGSASTESFTVASQTEITAVAPPGSGAVDVTVTTPEGTSPTSSADRFTYFEETSCPGTEPAITRVEPSRGHAGTTVHIIGKRFFYVCGDVGTSVNVVMFGSRAASFEKVSESEIVAVAPPGSGTVNVRAETNLGRVSPVSPSDEFTYEPPVEKAEYANWVLSGAITDKKQGQAITLPQGSTFNGRGEVNPETGGGSVSGSLAIPPLSAEVNLFGVLPLHLGMTISATGQLEGALAKSETVPGDESLKIPLTLNVGVTSFDVLGLMFEPNCTTTENTALVLSDTLSREELLSKGWSFSGTTTLPRFTCEGQFGQLLAYVLDVLLSGPENPYSLRIAAP